MQCLLDTTRESNWLGSVINGPITDEMRIAQRQELTALQQTTRTTALPSGQTETLLYLLDGLLCWNFTVFTSFNAKIKEWYLGSLKDMSFAPLNPFSLFNFMDCAPYAPSLLESTVFCTRPDMSFVSEDSNHNVVAIRLAIGLIGILKSYGYSKVHGYFHIFEKLQYLPFEWALSSCHKKI